MESPTQLLAPSQVRLRVRNPPLHVREHSAHCCQFLQMPNTTKRLIDIYCSSFHEKAMLGLFFGKTDAPAPELTHFLISKVLRLAFNISGISFAAGSKPPSNDNHRQRFTSKGGNTLPGCKLNPV